MTVSDAAIEAAAEAIRSTPILVGNPHIARVAIEAAMPAIREALAQEIDRAPSAGAPDDYFCGYRGGMADAARIVRGGTL